MEVASAGVQRAYVLQGSSVVAQRNADGQFYWLHKDHLGSGRKMTDTSGTMTYRAEFDPYGKLLLEWSQGNVANRNSKKFTSYERDQATGLDYAEARMYGSEWGRFMSPDPLGFASANKKSPKSLNRYSYVEGNPVNSVDPSGTLLANPDEPGGSACTMTIWGSGYRTDYGGFTFTNIWGGFWSCGGGGIGGGGQQPTQPVLPTIPYLTMTNLQTPEPAPNCGRVTRGVQWIVAGTYPLDFTGAVVQHVTFTSQIVGGAKITADYFEAWIMEGGVWTGKTADGNSDNGQDFFSFPGYSLINVEDKTNSFAKFIEGSEIVNIVKGWGFSAKYSNGLYSTNKKSPDGEKFAATWVDTTNSIERLWNVHAYCAEGKDGITKEDYYKVINHT